MILEIVDGRVVRGAHDDRAGTSSNRNLDGFKYPALARSARIGGTVQFLVKSDGIQLLSGHNLLVPAARSNLEKWAVPYASVALRSRSLTFSGSPIR